MMLEHVERWAYQALDWLRRRPPRFRVARVRSRPRWRRAATLYIVGDPGYAWCAVFTCPCGCGEEVVLNLLSDVRPRWEVTAKGNLVASVKPSVRRIRGCRSHFWIRRGRVEWCAA